MSDKQKVQVIYWITLSGILGWMTAIILAPLLKSLDSNWGTVLYSVFSPVCHQMSERCFHLWGYPLAVCSRCLGIYSGFLTGVLIFPIWKKLTSFSVPGAGLFLLLTGPLLIDTLGNTLVLWRTSPWLRFAFGWIWGIILPFYFVVGLSDAWIGHRESKQN